MANIVLPTSPNWYLSQISDTNRGGFYVFGARHDIAIFDISTVPRTPPRYVGAFCEHKDRVTCVKLGQTQSQLNLCCSSADDLKVKLWDVKTHVEIQSHSEHKEKITALSWSRCQRDLIVTADERGTIVKWLYTTDERQTFRYEKDYIFSLACCTHNASLLAVGYKSGCILLLNISAHGRILHRLRGHDDEIHCVLWCPVPGENVLVEGAYSGSDDDKGYLLASGSRDRTLRIWSSSQGKQLLVKKLPVNTGNRRDSSDSQGRNKVWTTLYWLMDSPTQLVSSSFSGELVMWDLSPVGHKPEIFYAGNCRTHTRVVFNICAGGEDMNTLFTVGMDRMENAYKSPKEDVYSIDLKPLQIVLWDLERQCSIYSIPSLGGHVYKVEISPLDPGRVALGVGDNMIRVWNTNNKTNPFDVNTIWQGIKSKVTALCWHPKKEGQLAFGTEDGRVGIYDVMSNKHPTLSSTFHRRTVYGVTFGPSSNQTEDDVGPSGLSLYSVGDMTVLEHKLYALNKEALNINTVIETVNGKSNNSTMRSDMAWKPDNSVVAIASDDGCVEIFQSGTFKLLSVVHVHHKLINCLKWHPQFTADNPHGSECQYWLASGANDAVINVVDLSSVLESTSETLGHISSSMRRLEGHSIRVTGIAWNPHVDGQLVSVGYDSIAYVWNVKTGEAMYQFEGHYHRLLCVVWSGTDPDEVMSGGFDSTLQRWKVSALPKAVIELGKKKKKKKADNGGRDQTFPSISTALASAASSFTEGEYLNIDDLGGGGDKPAMKETSRPQEVPDSKGDVPKMKKDQKQAVSEKRQKKSKERAKMDYQDELAELREMLEMRKQQILKEKQTYQTQQTPSDKQTHKVPDKSASGEECQQKRRVDELVTSRGDSDCKGLSVTRQSGKVPQEGLLHDPSWEDAQTQEDDDKNTRNREIVANILGSHYLSAEKKEDFGLEKDDSHRKEFTVRDFAGSKKRRGRPKSVFPASAKEENRGKAGTLDDLLLLTKLKISDPDTTPYPLADDKFHLGLFTDRRGTYRCLRKEGDHHLNNDNMEYAIQLEIWKGNVGGALQIARDREELSDWLVALAPLASHDTWLGVCEEYARQLEADGQYHKATSYLLACHKVYEAIDLFKRHRLFKEAIALARVRLSPLDPVLEDLYMEWAQTLMKDGNYEQAAKCYLAMKQIQDAATMLTKRSDQQSLKTATHMSMLANEKPQGFLYAHRLVHQFIAKDDWKQGYKFLKEHELLKMLLPFVSMHELLMKELQSLTPGTLREVDPACFTEWKESPTGKTFIPEFILDVTECDPVLPWKPYMIGEHSFPHHVLKVWYCNLDIGMDSESLTLMYRTLQQHQSGRQSHIDPQQLMFQVCMDLTLSLLAVLIGETSSSINHLLHAVSTLHTVGQFELMEAVCQLMLPLGPKYLLKLQQEATALRVLISMEAHLEVEGAGKAPSLKRYLTEIKDDDSISTSGLRCRELDCLRAYYYLAVLHFLKQSIRAKSLAQGQRTEASVDDDFKVKASQDLEQQIHKQTGESDGHHGERQSGTTGVRSGINEEASKNEASAAKSEKSAVEVKGKSDSDGSLYVSPTGQKEGSTSDKQTVDSTSEHNEKSTSGLQNVDSFSGGGVVKDTSGGAGEDGVSEGQNVEGAMGGLSALDKETAPASENLDQSNESSECQNNQELTISKLKQISRGLLWDVQAKKHSLTETLGYIHKAISKLLLADKSKDCQTVVFDHAPRYQAKGDNLDRTSLVVNGLTKGPDNNEVSSRVSEQSTDHASTTAQFSIPNGLQDGLFLPDMVPNTMDPCDMTTFSGPDTFSKSRKVLWEDEPHLCDSLDSRPRDPSCFLNPAKYINVPDEWYGMPVDEKYFRQYVTMAVLKEEQEYVMHELKRIPDIAVVSFPNPFDSVTVLLDVSRLCTTFDSDVKNNYTNQVALWALHFAVTSHERRELTKLVTQSLKSEESGAKAESSV